MSEFPEPGYAEERRSLTRKDMLLGSLAAGAALALPVSPAEAATAGRSLFTELAAGPKKGGRLRLAVSGGGVSESLDPHAINTPPDQARALNIYDRLAQTNRDLTVSNMLAQSIEPNKASTVWQVRIGKGIHFQNGRPLTADDLLFTLRRIGLDSKQPYHGALDMFDLKAARRVNATTVVFPLRRPYGDMPRLLASRFLGIVPSGQRKFSDPKSIIGTGPFKLGAFTP
jgi:peptide/nickel transport system substrate-binding protein